jgi:L-ascorbate metabolism protein UlaG (beta-lactamase superfamily)
MRADPQFGGAIFHTKGRGNGYVVTVGGKRIYLAGDTACTPEMKALKNIDVAFLPAATALSYWIRVYRND